MPAGREQAATLPEEILRQSGRVIEQLQCLFVILDTTTDHLEDMSGLMGNYSAELTAEINKLKEALILYRNKSNEIYTDVADGLRIYANNLLNSLSDLTTNVQSISDAIADL